MRKLFFASAVFLVLVVTFSFHFVELSVADVVGRGQECGQVRRNVPPDFCEPNLDCLPESGDVLGIKRCYERKDVNCTCNPGNEAQEGRNGFTCEGGRAGFCQTAKHKCDTGGTAEFPETPDAQDNVNFVRYKLNNIHCVEDRRVGPGEECSGKGCQSPVDNKIYTCQQRNGPLADGTYGFEGYFCMEAGNVAGCPKKGEDCNLIAAPESGGCCMLDEDNVTHLACDINSNKCIPQNDIVCRADQKDSPACHECAKENEACGYQVDGRTAHVSEDCCFATNANNGTLSCVDGNNTIIDLSSQKGTCKYRDNSAPPPGTIPALPPVAPPPCAEDDNGACKAFNTAFGIISTDTGTFLTQFFGLLLAASGAIAIALIMRAGYTILTSAGNPERVKMGQEQFTASVVGLLFIIFSFVIFQVLGVEILRLPDFTEQVPGPGANPGAPAPDHCNSCESAVACQNRGGTSRGALDCGIGQICCE